MIYRLCAGFALFAVMVGVYAKADEVFVKGREKSIKANVKSETGKEVIVGKETIPARDMIDVHYDDVSPAELRLAGGAYLVAKKAEKDSREKADAADRRKAMNIALANYEQTLKLMKPHKYANRNFEYKIALLTYQLAVADQKPTEIALVKLQAFKKKYPNSWQVSHVMPLVAQIQMDAKDYKGAEETFAEMAEMEVLPDEVRRESEMMVVQVNVRAGNIDRANVKLDALAKKAVGNPLFASRIQMTRAEILVSQKKMDQAVPILHQVIKENNDKHVKAIAHNTLGECLFKSNKHNEALWEFLWVDTVYNQDKEQRAKALYYLWLTFEQLNNAERGQECRLMLANDPMFAGTEYQRIALAKGK